MTQLSKEEIVAELADYLNKETHIKDKLGANTDIMDLGLDSLDIMNYVFHIEEQYGITLADELIEKEGFMVIGTTVDHILENSDS